MPIPVTYTPIQPRSSTVGLPVIWTDNRWIGTTCPGTPPTPEIWSITVTNFTPIIAPAPYNGDPGIILSLTPGTVTAGGAGVITTGPLTGPVTATLNATGNYTDYLFPNKEYKYRSDISVKPAHSPTPVVDTNGYISKYGTLNQLTAVTRGPFLNPVIGSPIAGTPTIGMIEEIQNHEHMIHYFPDPRYIVVVRYNLVITSSCGIGAGTYSISQIVYDNKDIASKRFITKVESQTGRVSPPNPFPNPLKQVIP